MTMSCPFNMPIRYSRIANESIENIGKIRATLKYLSENPDGNVILSFKEFDAPAETVQMAKKLLSSSIGSLKVNLPRETALGIKTGQMVWITGRPNVVAQDNFILGAMGEALNPALATFRFPLDIESLLTLRMLDYTVGLKNN